jgi:hypothetical protein
MAAPRDGRSKLRASTGVLQTLSQGWNRSGAGGTIYARAQLERAEITEEYFVEQEISKNPWARGGKEPAGRIELSIPYDGYKFFTRLATDDVAYSTGGDPPPAASAVIGHLLLRDYARTNLREQLNLADRHSSVPIEVPVADGSADHLDLLTSDRQACVSSYDFEPEPPVALPARLEINLFDQDSLDFLQLDPFSVNSRTDEGKAQINKIIGKIAQQANFRDELVLHIVVRLTLPAPSGLGPLRPKVARMAIDWPTITSLRTLSLQVGVPSQDGRSVRFEPAPVHYNPVLGCIEWENVKVYRLLEAGERPDEEMGESRAAERYQPEEGDRPEAEFAEPDETDEPGATKTRHYLSAPMLLTIEHPGELYKQDILSVVADTRIPGYLMSGTTARLYDATGYFLGEPLKLNTRIRSTAELTLDDAFSNRDFSPNYHLFFDEIIPDEMRITDIKTALDDRGFTVEKVWPDHDGADYNSSTGTVTWLYRAYRKVGPDDMVLWILATGRHYETERERVMQGGGVTHKTKLQTGELRVFIRGSLRRDSRELTHTMNQLQRTLRERYERVRQRR